MTSENKNVAAQVTGVFKYNEDTRGELLRRIYWKDKQYTRFGDGLAKYVTIKDRAVLPITEGKSLFDFTHDKSNSYSMGISHKYDIHQENVFEVEPYKQNLQKWEGDYREAYSISNKLGEIADVKFAVQRTYSNSANQVRHLENKYLTPELTKFYGSNITTEGNLRTFSIFARGGWDGSWDKAYEIMSGEYSRESGRIPDIPEANVGIVHDYDYESGDVSGNNGGIPYLEEQLSKVETGFKPSNIESKWRYTSDKLSESFNLNGVKLRYQKGDKDTSKENEYDEGDEIGTIESETLNDPDNNFNTKYNGNNLLSKTNELFKTHRISTLVARFHTSKEIDTGKTVIDTAKSSYGNSHGRNLIRKGAGQGGDKINNYDNPYCRVWTYHHQYDRLSRQIRPFFNDEINPESIESTQSVNSEIRAHSYSGVDILNGGKYLADNTVLGKGGFVNITPSKQMNNEVDIKKCMFSIENLAWKDVPRKEKNLSKEQIGPNGGRIMWFPPYDLDFQENVNVDWDSNDFIGRGEKVYTYKNTQRQGTLSFSLLIDHPGVIDVIKNKTGNNGDDDADSMDILRFFAGCGKLDDWKLENTETTNDASQNTNNDEGKLTTSDDNAKRIRFYVYFPNNYSGNDLTIGKNDWEREGVSNSNWYKYLLTGKGTLLPVSFEEPNLMNGYEITNNGLGETEEGTKITPSSKTKNCVQWKEADSIYKTENFKSKAYEISADKTIIYLSKEDKTGIKANNINKNDAYVIGDDSNNQHLYISNGEIWEEFGYNYAVDFDLKQVLKTNSNYIDNTSYKLNSVLDTSISLGATHSFAEIMAALLYLKNDAESNEIKEFLYTNGVSAEKTSKLATTLSKATITSVTVKGAATLQDSAVNPSCQESNSKMLAKRRAKAICTTLKHFFDKNNIKYSDNGDETIKPLQNPSSVNTKEAKAQRYAVVDIVYNSPENKSAEDAENNEGETIADTLKRQKTLYKPIDTANATGVASSTINDNTFVRYETEAEYFDKLSSGNDSVIFKSLKKKFKYFTPAFHSISPEGFNARLTFLQQCTRQGHTIENSNSNEDYRKTAGNLSFGRMPVCVLRLGDFLNTRILITSMNINYGKDGIQWDLNPEGAGVQPMYAQVSLGIVILGGQSLTGPISRLQNAVSFNYYANTGVYDNRADRMEPKIDEKTGHVQDVYTHLWTPETK